MHSLTMWLIKKTIPDYKNIENQQVRSRYGMVGGWISIWVNLVLFALKLILGLISGSMSLIADAMHTLSDVATSVVIVASFKVAKKPADAEHPFGHGRMEAVATLVVAIILILVGFELGKGAVERIRHPQAFEASWRVMGLIVMTIFGKEGLGRISREMGRMIASPALEADFWHHRIDAISSILVLVAFAGQHFGLFWLDGAMGLGVSVMIVWTGGVIVKEGIDDLLGRAPDTAWVQSVKHVALSFAGVVDVHDLIVHHYGRETVISMHVSMDETLSFTEAHSLGTRVGKKVDAVFHTHSTVHLDPVPVEADTLAIAETLKALLSSGTCPLQFYDLRLEGLENERVLHLHIRTEDEASEERVQHCLHELISEIRKQYRFISDVTVEMGPRFVY